MLYTRCLPSGNESQKLVNTLFVCGELLLYMKSRLYMLYKLILYSI